MKIAICLSGLTRCHERSLKSIKENFEEADVFAHSYEVKNLENIIKDTWSKDVTKNYYESEKETTEQILQKYLPKAYRIDQYDQISDFFKFIHTMAVDRPEDCNLSAISMFYSIHMANNLKKAYEHTNNFKYDITVRMRYDSQLKDFSPHNYDTNSLYIPQADDSMIIQKGQGINDQFAFGPSDMMDIYSDLFMNIIDTAKKCGRLSSNVVSAHFPEHMLSQHLSDKKLTSNIKRPYVNVTISKSREWLHNISNTPLPTNHPYEIKTLTEATKTLNNTDNELFHDHDSIFIKEDETNQNILTILIFSGSQFWPKLPDCCKPGLKGSIKVKITDDQWEITERNVNCPGHLQFLVDYLTVLCNESNAKMRGALD